MSAILCALLLWGMQPAAAPSPNVRIDLVFDGTPMPRRLKTSALAEATSIWAAYGVDLRESRPNEAVRDGAIRLSVAVVDSVVRQKSIDMLGSIEFRGTVPEPSIALYPAAIEELVSNAARLGGTDAEFAASFHDVTLGRAMGRALAHEIGHYLLRSRDHSGKGLMRAIWLGPVVVGWSRRPFALSADEVKRLSTLLPSSPFAADQ
jgi:hypothetical protein